MLDLPPYVAPARFDDAHAALQRVLEIHAASVGHLSARLQQLVAGTLPAGRVRACYPVVRLRTDGAARGDSRLAWGSVAGPGAYESTLTRPDLFAASGRRWLDACGGAAVSCLGHGHPAIVAAIAPNPTPELKIAQVGQCHTA
jgi:hypothetical protein